MANCKIKKEIPDNSLWDAFLAMREQDSWTKYKMWNDNYLWLTNEEVEQLSQRWWRWEWNWFSVDSLPMYKSSWYRAKSLWIYEWDNAIALTDTYLKLKDHIIRYSESDTFMDWLLKPLYWDDLKLLYETKDKLRRKTLEFFSIIENTTNAKTQLSYLQRLVDNVIDQSANDINMFLMIEPTAQDIVKNPVSFKNFFWLDVLSFSDYKKIANWIAQKWWISIWLPWSIEWMKSLTVYKYIPDTIKDYWLNNKFKLPEAIWDMKAWTVLDISNSTFVWLSNDDQYRLFELLFEEYKVRNPDLTLLWDEIISKTRYLWKHRMDKVLSWLKIVYKVLTSSHIYNFWLLTAKWFAWAVALWTLNWMQFISRHLSDARWWFWIKWDWRKFYDTRWLWWQNDMLVSKFLAWDMAWFMRWSMEKFATMLWAWLYNMSDVLYSSNARRMAICEYINVYHPHVWSLEEFSSYLLMLPDELRKAELDYMSQFIDEKMFKRHNQSIDDHRVVQWWLTVKSELWQEAINAASNLRSFYRNYMKTSSKNFRDMLTQWRKTNSASQVREMMEKYLSREISRDELNDFVYSAYSKNVDCTRLLSALLYSFYMTKIIIKADYHSNWLEWESDNEAIVNSFWDLMSLFYFPIEAWQRTDTWLIFMAAFDAISNEITTADEDFAWVIMNEYDTIRKQLQKKLFMFRTIANVNWRINRMEKDWEEITFNKVFNETIDAFYDITWWFWYYLKDELERSEFDMYIPKIHSALVKELTPVREAAIKRYDDMNKAENIRKVLYDDESWLWDRLSNRIPIYSDYLRWTRSENEWFKEAFNELEQQYRYQEYTKWNLTNMTDDDWQWLYNRATRRSNADPDLNMFTDLSFIWDDWKLVTNEVAQVKEKIRHQMMKDNVDKDLFDKTVELLLDAEYSQPKALQALNYLNAQTPWAWQKLLSFVMNYERFRNIYYYKRYWDVKNNPELLEQAKREESIRLAKKYWENVYITDKKIRNQLWLRLAKESNISISEMIVPNEFETSYKLKRENWDYTSTELWEAFLLQNVANIAAMQWMPDAYKIYNIFSKVWSEVWKKYRWWEKQWELKEYAIESSLKNYNWLMDHTKNLWISRLEQMYILAPALLQSEKFIKEYIRWKDYKTLQADETFQTWLWFLRWINRDVNEFAAKAISQEIEAKQLPDWTWDIWFSFWNTLKGKYWKNKRKDYYNKNSYFNKEMKNLSKRYVKYFNKFYIFPQRNATPSYSRKEWYAAWYATILSSVWKWTSKSRKADKQQPWWYIKQGRWSARPFVNWWDLDRIPDRKTKPKNRRTRSRAIGSKLWNRLIPWRRRYVKQLKRDLPTLT